MLYHTIFEYDNDDYPWKIKNSPNNLHRDIDIGSCVIRSSRLILRLDLQASRTLTGNCWDFRNVRALNPS